MTGRIFVNYRRDDDPGFAQLLYSQMEAAFPGQLFMDVEGHIKPGDDFVQVLKGQVAATDVILVVIGPRWGDLLAQRAGDPNDFVALEIKEGLEQGKLVVPVLVGDAQFPRSETLPDSIRALANRNAVSLRRDRFRADCEGLISAVKDSLAAIAARKGPEDVPQRRVAIVVVDENQLSEPGQSVNRLVRSLSDHATELTEKAHPRFDPHNEVYELVDPTVGSTAVAFPVFVRHATFPGHARTSFFELYFSDLTRTGQGVFGRIADLARLIFEIPHLVDGFSRNPPGPLSQIYRSIVLFLCWFIRGPFLGYCAVIVATIAIFESFKFIPDHEDVRRLFGISASFYSDINAVPINPDFRLYLFLVLAGLLVASLILIVWGRQRTPLVAGGAFVATISVFYMLDSFVMRPHRYPDYVGMVYVDYLYILVVGVAAIGMSIFVTQRKRDAGIADVGLFMCFWSILLIVGLEGYAFQDFDTTIRAASSSIQFRILESFYPFSAWLTAVVALLTGLAFAIALVLYVLNFWRWPQGYRATFAALALASLQFMLVVIALTSIVAIHLDGVLCAGNRYAEYLNEREAPPPLSCQTKLRQNYEIVSLLRTFRSAEENREIGFVLEVRQQLERALNVRERFPLNQAMLRAVREFYLTFIWHSTTVMICLLIFGFITLYRHIVARVVNARVSGAILPRLVISAFVILALIIVTITNSVLGLSWVEQYLPLHLRPTDLIRAISNDAVPIPDISHLSVSPEVGSIVVIVVCIIVLAFQLPIFRSQLKGVLPMLQGMIDHQYRLTLGTTGWLFRSRSNASIRRENIAQRIEVLMKDLISAEKFDDVVFLANGQGSVIVYDYLRKQEGQVLIGVRPHVITMGSPISVLYEYYINEYTNVAIQLGNLRIKPASWINFFRIDDPVGGPISGSNDFVRNVALAPGGHYGYWEEVEVNKAFMALITADQAVSA